MKEIIKKSKEVLEKEVEELRKKIKDIETHEPDSGDDVDHFDEEADEATDYAANLGKIEAYKERLEEAEEELRKMAR